MTIDTILFDLDGTLVQHSHVLLPEKLTEWGYPRSPEDVRIAFTAQIHWFYDYAARIKGTAEDTPTTWDAVWPRLYGRVTAQLEIDDPAVVAQMVDFFADDPTPPLYDDALPLLETLAQGPWRLGMITQRGRRGALRFLSDHNLSDRFHVIIAGDDGHGRKPDPTPFQRALSVLKSDARHAIFIGDRVDDDCGGACSAGLRAFLIDRYGTHADGEHQGEVTYIRLESLLDLLHHLNTHPEEEAQWPLPR